MGTNNYTTKNPGDVVSSDDPNQYKTGLTSDVVPRNTSGIPTDQAGSLGSTIYRWLRGFFIEVVFGDPDAGTKITSTGNNEATGILQFMVASVVRAKVDKDGITRDSFPSSGVLKELKIVTYTGNGSWSPPLGVNNVVCMIAGGGGGGGGGSGGYSGGVGGKGGGGGGGAPIVIAPLQVVPGGTVNITIGAGGNGGGGGTANGDGTNGSPGGNTIVASEFDSLTAYGGGGGSGGTENTPGAGGSGQSHPFISAGGGKGGEMGVAPVSGFPSIKAPAGSTGASYTPGGGGGGGGGASLGVGGVGGNGSNGSGAASVGNSPPAALSGKGGGGGGGGAGQQGNSIAGAAGGNGAPGLVYIFYLD